MLIAQSCQLLCQASISTQKQSKNLTLQLETPACIMWKLQFSHVPCVRKHGSLLVSHFPEMLKSLHLNQVPWDGMSVFLRSVPTYRICHSWNNYSYVSILLKYDTVQEVFLIELFSPDFTLWKRPTKKASPNIILENFWTSKTVTAVSKIDRSFRTYF